MNNWTREVPSTPGYYWYWQDGKNRAELIEVFAVTHGHTLSFGGHNRAWARRNPGYWQGPIELPQPPQGTVEGGDSNE